MLFVLNLSITFEPVELGLLGDFERVGSVSQLPQDISGAGSCSQKAWPCSCSPWPSGDAHFVQGWS